MIIVSNARTPAISADINIGAECMTLTFGNGSELRLELGQLTADIATQAMWHGLKQKLVDAAAISRDPDTGRSATIADKYDAVREVYDRLLAGEWNKTREGGGGSGGLLLRALVIAYPNKTREALIAYLDGKSKVEQAALRKTAKLAAIIDELRVASAGDIDTDELLGELDD